MPDPNNTNRPTNPVGRFMVAVGAVIQHSRSGRLLLVRRSPKLDWQPSEWEIVYGRLDQYEDAITALKREVQEETGLTDLAIGRVLRVWHIYRGSRQARNELIGITFYCRTGQEKITLSAEHSACRWTTPQIALQLITTPGIKQDIIAFQKLP